MTRPRFDEVVDGLVARGAIGADDAAALRDASRWPFGAVEAVAALGGLLVGVGVLVVLGSLVEDLSQLAFAGVLALLAAVALAARRALTGRPRAMLARDVLEVVAIALAAFAAGTAIERTGWSGEAVAVTVALPVAAVGLWRAGRTRFAGSVVGPVGAASAALAAAALVRSDADLSAVVFVVVGVAILAWAARTRPGSPALARFVGAGAVMLGVLIPGPEAGPDVAWSAAAVVVALALFVRATRAVRLEMLVPAAIGLVGSVARVMGDAFDDETLQGAATIVIGAVVLAATVRRLRATRTA